MANQYTKLTAQNIITKMNRRSNPVDSIAMLAREFGQTTAYSRREGGIGSAAPGAFRNRVIALVGEDTYNDIRREMFINKAYR